LAPAEKVYEAEGSISGRKYQKSLYASPKNEEENKRRQVLVESSPAGTAG
jgi:hypothetical protein